MASPSSSSKDTGSVGNEPKNKRMAEDVGSKMQTEAQRLFVTAIENLTKAMVSNGEELSRIALALDNIRHAINDGVQVDIRSS